MFMHGNIIHPVGNMHFLYVTGDNVEERFGWCRYLGFYLLCGLVAGAANVALAPMSEVPCVGASVAISGVLGAYVVLFPNNRFVIRWFYFLWAHFAFRMPVWAYFGLWIGCQFLCAQLDVPGMAWWAHIGRLG
jgi:membrane associated rhomboid family serine protease